MSTMISSFLEIFRAILFRQAKICQSILFKDNCLYFHGFCTVIKIVKPDNDVFVNTQKMVSQKS